MGFSAKNWPPTILKRRARTSRTSQREVLWVLVACGASISESVAAGAAGDENSSNFALARYTSDGELDATFGLGGQVITGFGNNLASIVALVLQSDGNIVAVGNFGSLDSARRFVNNIAVVRYLGQ